MNFNFSLANVETNVAAMLPDGWYIQKGLMVVVIWLWSWNFKNVQFSNLEILMVKRLSQLYHIFF